MKIKSIIILLLAVFFFSCNNVKKDKPIEDHPIENSVQATKDLDLKSLEGKAYDEARKMILEAEWSPLEQDAKVAMADGGVALYGNGKIFWERGYHEVEACSGTGLGFCIFHFMNKDGEALNVTTQGEQAEDNEYNATVKEAWITKAIKRKTIEDFWTLFKKAVAERDMATLEMLYEKDAQIYKFGNPEYQAKIAESQASDVKDSGEMNQGKKVFQFEMVFPNEGAEESTTNIYIQQNNAGDFEIFNVLEAG